MQVRPRAVLLPTPASTSHGRETAASATADATIPGHNGVNHYYPTLLSDSLTLLGGGLCWGLAKASVAANLSPPGATGGAGEGSGCAGGGVISEATRGEEGGEDPAVEASFLQAKPRGALLLIFHLLRIDVRELETASAIQVNLFFFFFFRPVCYLLHFFLQLALFFVT